MIFKSICRDCILSYLISICSNYSEWCSRVYKGAEFATTNELIISCLREWIVQVFASRVIINGTDAKNEEKIWSQQFSHHIFLAGVRRKLLPKIYTFQLSREILGAMRLFGIGYRDSGGSFQFYDITDNFHYNTNNNLLLTRICTV